MTAVARRPKAGRWHSPWMNPSPSCLTVHVLSPMCDLQSSKNEMWSFSEWLRERIVPAVGEKWVATIPESFQKWWGCKKIFKDKEAGGGADGAAGFTHSGQPGQRLGRVSGSGCKTPALSEQSSRWGPHRVHTPGTQRGRRQGKKKNPWQEDRGPICLFQSISSPTIEGPCSRAPLPKPGSPPSPPLPSSQGCSDNNLSSKIFSSLPKPRAEQSHRICFYYWAPISAFAITADQFGFCLWAKCFSYFPDHSKACMCCPEQV